MSQRHPLQNQLFMFITTNCQHREWIFADDAAARIAIETLYHTQEYYPFFLYGFVIMPDHCHFLMKIPEYGSISKVMQQYKRSTSHAIGRGPIWQKRFHMRLVDDPIGALRYIYMNPVLKGLSETPETYPWSSASGNWDIANLDS